MKGQAKTKAEPQREETVRVLLRSGFTIYLGDPPYPVSGPQEIDVDLATADGIVRLGGGEVVT